MEPAERREVEAPSPFGLASELFLGGLFAAFVVCDIGVCRRALSGESNHLQFAEFYFAEDVPVKDFCQDLVGIAFALAVPRLLYEHAAQLWKGRAHAHHWLGVVAAAAVAATVAVDALVLGPRAAAADEHFFSQEDAERIAPVLAAKLALALVGEAGVEKDDAPPPPHHRLRRARAQVALSLLCLRTYATAAAACGVEVLFSPL